jgi:hypothetical protein
VPEFSAQRRRLIRVPFYGLQIFIKPNLRVGLFPFCSEDESTNPFIFNSTMAAAKVNNFHLVNSQADYVRIFNLSFYS